MTITAVTGSRRQLQHIALVHQAFASSRRAADFAHGIHVESALLRQVSRLSDLDRLRLSRSTGQVLLVALHSFVEVERALALRAVGGHGAARAALLARHAVWLVAMLVLMSGWCLVDVWLVSGWLQLTWATTKRYEVHTERRQRMPFDEPTQRKANKQQRTH